MFQKNEDPASPINSTAIATLLIKDYWLNNVEISFPIDSIILKRMLGTSPTNLVGVRVENFTNPTTVSLTWISFEEDNIPADSTSANIFYAMINKELADEITSHPVYNIINARLARKQSDVSTSPTNFCVFFHKSKLTGKGGGTGGTGDGSGAIVR